MNHITKRTHALVIAIGLVATGAATRAHAAESYRISGGEVTVLCPLTVGGSFEAKTKTLSGEIAPAADQSGAVGGTLKVELQTLETGIASAPHEQNYLEVRRPCSTATSTTSVSKSWTAKPPSPACCPCTQRRRSRAPPTCNTARRSDQGAGQFALKVPTANPARTTSGRRARRDSDKVALTATPVATTAQNRKHVDPAAT